MLWFRYQQYDEVNQVIQEGLYQVKVTIWLQVIPQLIARIHITHVKVSQILHELLIHIGKLHPQGIIYSLMVASRSSNKERKVSAFKILDSMKHHSLAIVNQVL
jgi:FKBP12-rapamycin complex-associated protein